MAGAETACWRVARSVRFEGSGDGERSRTTSQVEQVVGVLLYVNCVLSHCLSAVRILSNAVVEGQAQKKHLYFNHAEVGFGLLSPPYATHGVPVVVNLVLGDAEFG